MRLPGRGPRGREGRVVAIEDSTLGRAGDAATRLALEETLLRRGWRVLFFEDHFGPLVGPQGTHMFDGLAVRLRPGTDDRLELRLLRVESDTLEVPDDLQDRVKRAARAASLEWLVAAFDGESMRLVPELGEVEPPPARVAPAPMPARVASAPPFPSASVAARDAAGRRPSSRGREPDEPSDVASRPRALPGGGGRETRAEAPQVPGEAETPARRGRRRGGRRGTGGRAGKDASATASEERRPQASDARASSSGATRSSETSREADVPPARRGRRRGKRGGRRRSGGGGA